MALIIRKAKAEDIDAIANIYAKIHSIEEQGLVTIGWQRGVYPEKETAQAALKRDDLFVAEQDGQIVASAILNQQQVDVYDTGNWQYKVPADKVMVMHTLVVDPDLQKSGLGRAFVAFYEKYAFASILSRSFSFVISKYGSSDFIPNDSANHFVGTVSTALFNSSTALL